MSAVVVSEAAALEDLIVAKAPVLVSAGHRCPSSSENSVEAFECAK